jgi:serine/threonine protein kinase/outer membrane biosynthesis protein TonB
VNTLEGGHHVGRYRIERFLGAGAMGEVYLAEDPQIDRKLAIKTVRLVGRPSEIDERKKRLLREARAAGRLLHPNIVTLFDAGEAEGLLFLAFEFVEGTDLAARLEAGQPRLSLRDVMRVARQAADALDYAHNVGIVHRDIKPSNILLDRAGRVKVADFGIAKMAGQSTELTMAGSVMGSPQYLSPEQIRGEELDGRSDIFSLGVVLYELLSGKRPFDGDTITTLVYQILHKDPPPVSELRAVPPRLEELLRRMLAKDRDERVATAGEIARELSAIEVELADETLSAPAGTGPMDATYILPRSTRGTVPAAPETTPSIPPPPAVAPQTLYPPPPPVPQPVPQPAGTMLAAGARSRSSTVVVLLVAFLLVAALAGAGWMAMSRFRGAPPAEQQQAATPSDPGASPTTAPVDETVPQPSTAPPVNPVETARPEPAPVQEAPTPAKQQPPAPAPRQETAPPLPQERPQTKVPAPVVSEPAPTAPAPERAPEPRPELRETETAPAEPAPSPSIRADQALRTGLNVSFRVTPPDAHVLVERRVIGTAQEWSGQKGARTYTFPGPGTYEVKIRKAGMKEQILAVEAGAGGASTITIRLRPEAAEAVDASDLRTVRVREAIAFRVKPPVAGILVDGQPVGTARRFSGGGPFRARGEWLELPPGKHRVSILAPGHQRQDILVEVSATADKDRERIDVVLAPEG